ncbi:MAG: AAA family ATPase [Candidatus Obscuribacterales bacterium]|nr:AAA family ATPase [Candidatus Obscuribacterales bacterium]
MSFEKNLEKLLQARFTLIVLVTSEESRAMDRIKETCVAGKRPLVTWDIGDGFQILSGTVANLPSGVAATNPAQAIEAIDQSPSDALFVLKDFDEIWTTNYQIKRKLRNVVQRLKQVKRKSILVISTASKIPEQLRDEAFVLEFPLPQVQDLEGVLELVSKVGGAKIQLTELGKEKLLRAALGLTASQATRCFSKGLVTNGVLDDRHIELVTDEKRQVIRESEALEFFPVTETTEDVGGLEILKEWLRVRERAFTDDARNYQLPAPKGMALIGIPGTGKSLSAKIVGSSWKMPLLRLDTGALFGGLLGESEERTRRALRVAETIAPCVLWIDEMEKAFSQGGEGDGGTSKRVFGTILTWMQEKKSPCFVVATANDVTKLPPELLRRGRFDEIFFLDLPTADERREIFTVHIRKRKRQPKDYDLNRLVALSEGYVGAEIEQSVLDGMYFGFDEGREFDTQDIENALKRQIPMSRSQSDVVNSLRKMLLEGRAQSASFKQPEQAKESFVELNLELAH